MRPEPDTSPATVLVIDTATEACSVALLSRGQVIAADHAVMGRGHAERLVPMIAALPGKGRAASILVNCGPGSFTGVRVGLAAARALALAWDVPVHGYSTHALIAAMARAQLSADVGVDCVMTGGHGEYFVQSFDAAGEAISPLQSLPPAQAVAACTQPVVAGSMASALVDARGFGEAINMLPDARAAGLLPASAYLADADPVYGRGADAKPMAMRTPPALQPG